MFNPTWLSFWAECAMHLNFKPRPETSKKRSSPRGLTGAPVSGVCDHLLILSCHLAYFLCKLWKPLHSISSSCQTTDFRDAELFWKPQDFPCCGALVGKGQAWGVMIFEAGLDQEGLGWTWEKAPNLEKRFFKIFFFLKIIVDLQCSVNFCCTAKWPSYTYVCVCIYIYTYIHSFPHILSCSIRSNWI